MSKLQLRIAAETERDLYHQAARDVPIWIEEALSGRVGEVPEAVERSLLEELRKLDLVMALSPEVRSPLFEEAYQRDLLKRALALQELESVIFSIFSVKGRVVVGGELALYLAVTEEEGGPLAGPEVCVWVPSDSFLDVLRILGKAGFRSIEGDGSKNQGVTGSVFLQSAAGAPLVKIIRFRAEADVLIHVPSMWDHSVPGSLRDLPRGVSRPSGTDLLLEFMRDFSDFRPSALRSLVSARILLESRLGKEVDWVRLTKVLAAVGSLGSAIAGFYILNRVWGVPLDEPLQSLVNSRARGLGGEVLRGWFSAKEFVRGSVSPLKRLLGRWTALRPSH